MKHLILSFSLVAFAGVACARSAAAAAPAASDAASATPQHSKMKACNADAKSKSLHGDDRRAFMKQCLSGKAKPPAAS